jgi:hypothetical protein
MADLSFAVEYVPNRERDSLVVSYTFEAQPPLI